MKVVFVDNFSLNFGVMYLAAVLEKAGYDVELLLYPLSKWHGIDQYNRPEKYFNFEKISQEILSKKPDILCFSVFSPNYLFFKNAAQAIKKRSHVPIIVGGVLPSLVPQLFLKNSLCDFLLRGEAEGIIVDLAESILSGNKEHPIPNLIYRNDHGAFITNAMASFVEDLDALPFYKKNLYPNSSDQLFIITSRGCPMKCAYCSAGTFTRLTVKTGAMIRRRSVNNVIAEIKAARNERSYKEIFFYDDFFIADAQWLTEFSETYAHEIGLPFYCLAFPATITKNIAQLLATSGCKNVELGFQTACEEYKKTVLSRKEDNRTVIQAMNILKEQGIKVTIDHIFNLPGETRADIEQSLNFYLNNRIKSLSLFFLNYYPDSVLTQYAYKSGIITPEQFEKIINNELIGEQSYMGTVLDRKKAVETVKVAMLFRLISFLPAKIVRWIFKTNSYRFFPANKFLYYGLSMLSELKNRDLNFILMTFFLAFKKPEQKADPHNSMP